MVLIQSASPTRQQLHNPAATPQPALDSPVCPLSSIPRLADASTVNYFPSLSHTQNSPYVTPPGSSYTPGDSFTPMTNALDAYSVPTHATPVRPTSVHSNVPIHAATNHRVPVHPAPVHVVNEFMAHTRPSHPKDGPQYNPLICSDGPHPLNVLETSVRTTPPDQILQCTSQLWVPIPQR